MHGYSIDSFLDKGSSELNNEQEGLILLSAREIFERKSILE